MGIPIRWLAHLPDQAAKNSFEDVLRNSGQVLGRLQQICEQNLQSIENQTTGPEQFKDPSWPYHTAYRQGQQAAYKDLMRLLSFTNDG
jgi:hypothetical protein